MSSTKGIETNAARESLRVLCVIPNPSDLAPLPVERLWDSVRAPSASLAILGQLILERAADLTEAGLHETLLRKRYNIVYFVGAVRSRAAGYTTLPLLTASGRARQMTATSIANLLSNGTGVELVVFQSIDGSDSGLDEIAQVVAERGLTVICAPHFEQREQQRFIERLIGGVLKKLSPQSLDAEIAALRASNGSLARVHSLRRVGSVVNSLLVIDVDSPAKPDPVVLQPSGAVPSWRDALAAKRAAQRFDVFLCHNAADKSLVIEIGQRLKESGILPWLDQWELQPGQPWQRELERQIENISAAAVFVGSAGFGPWQTQEVDGLLREFAVRKVPVIPTLLTVAPKVPELPVFLRAMTWVDFRITDPDPLARLIWGITGRRPAE